MNYIQTLKDIAQEVYDNLGSGHSECVYHNAIKHELILRGIKFESEVVRGIYYKGLYVGQIRCDLIIEKKLIVELKTQDKVAFKEGDSEVRQINKYLKNFEINDGLLINFSKTDRDKFTLGVIFKEIKLDAQMHPVQ